MKHSTPAVSVPGNASGHTTLRNPRPGAAPRLRAASSIRGSMVSMAACIVSTANGSVIDTMPDTTANVVYISSSPAPPSPRTALSTSPPRANRIIQPTIRTVLPTNSGSTTASMHHGFHRGPMRASR